VGVIGLDNQVKILEAPKVNHDLRGMELIPEETHRKQKHPTFSGYRVETAWVYSSD